MNGKDDLISRQAAIDAIDVKNVHKGIISALQSIIRELPSAQPEPCEDTIGRKMAIDALIACKGKDPFNRYEKQNIGLDWGIEALKQLPSVQPVARDTNVLSNDTISKQAAIDALDGYILDETTDLYGNSVREILEQLPPVQPEIVRCKDCKYRMPYDWMFSEVWQSQSMDDYPEDEIGCAYCDMSMSANDFCSRAERRTDG